MYNPLEQKRFEKMHIRYSKLKQHESDVCLAAFNAKGKPVLRVVNYRERKEAERAVRMAAAGPEMAETLQSTCTYIRQCGLCLWPDCSKCKIFSTLNKLEDNQ